MENAIKIASQYHGPDAAAWQQAAASLRMPYWDWALHPVPPPEVIELQTLNVTGPNGKVTVNPNPLLSYHYKSDEPRVDNRPFTVRCPDRQNPNQTNVKALKT